METIDENLAQVYFGMSIEFLKEMQEELEQQEDLLTQAVIEMREDWEMKGLCDHCGSSILYDECVNSTSCPKVLCTTTK